MKKILLSLFILSLTVEAVTIRGSLGVTGAVDFRTSTATAPIKTGTSLPAICSIGQVFFKTDAVAGQNIYICTNANTWTQIQGTTTPEPNYSQSFTNQTTVALSHNKNTTDVIVSCYDSSNVEFIPNTVTITDANTVTVTFGSSKSGKCVVNTSGGYTSGGGGGGSGTVTSVGLSVPSGFSVSGSPVTTSGTISISTSLNGVIRGTGSGFTTVSGNASDCVKVDGTSGACSAGGVTSVGLSVPSGFSVSGSPITSSGTISISTSLNGVVRATGSGFTTVSGNALDCVRVDGTSFACSGAGNIYTGTGLTGDGTASNPIKIDPSGAVASQAFFTAGLDFPSISAGSCSELNITATGATAGATVVPGWPSTLNNGLVGMMYSGTDVIVVRLCNVTASAIDPASLTFSARIIGGF